MGSVRDLNKRKVNSMTVYTITLQFQVEAEDTYTALRMSHLVEYDLPVRELDGLLGVLETHIHNGKVVPTGWEQISNGEGE